MRLSELIKEVEIISIALPDVNISGIQFDSRKVQSGDCFLAMKGETTDGNRFIKAALERGAVAVVSDTIDQSKREEVGWVHIPGGSGRRAMGKISANFYGNPARKLKLIGITGTNGKTTTSYLIENIFNEAKKKSVLIGTIEYRIAGDVIASPHTTPESLELNKLFSEALAKGAADGVMEVSSHALAQERVFGIPFEISVFTNLTRDHLDYHEDMESYFEAKSVLFRGCGAPPPKVCVINQDDAYGRRLMATIADKGPRIVTYGLKSGDFHVGGEMELRADGTKFKMATPVGTVSIESQLVGQVNVYNILAASAAAHARGISTSVIAQAISGLRYVPGRFQRVSAGQPFTVVVDYAHTDDALRNLTEVARTFVTRDGSRGKVITMFGCGGDRDRAKRPMMGTAAARGSDFVILTSDNPRSEDPLQIIHDALGALRTAGTEYTIEPDRKRAISLAVRLAKPGDIVLLAGKGHEKIQVTKKGTEPFDDVEVAEKALRMAGYAKGRKLQ